MDIPNTSAPPTRANRHPRGLYTLFFTEMWERFSFYGMRALLVLFLVDNVRGGMGLTDKTANAIYGLYGASVYFAALPGGWLADRLLGARRSVFYGGVIIACGHFVLAIPNNQTFFLGLILVVLGTGLLKPNVSAMVGDLYPEGGARRDAGFTIFYMGINLGAAIGPLICSQLGEHHAWHYGFGAAGVAMVAGLIQYKLTERHLGNIGLMASHSKPLSGVAKIILGSLSVIILLVLVAAFSGHLHLDPVKIASGAMNFIVATGVLYFIFLFFSPGLTARDKRHLGVIVMLFVVSAIFWAGFEQVGSSFNLFAERHTNRSVSGWMIPAGWFQSLGPVFIILFAPVVAAVWVALAKRGSEPSLPSKFAVAMLFLAGGLAVMALAAHFTNNGKSVLPTWLIATYFLHTVGELCLSPVGLSSVTKLAPPKLVGQLMGLWFLATALGNLLAGIMAGNVSEKAAGDELTTQFLQIAILPTIVAVLLFLIIKPIKRLMV